MCLSTGFSRDTQACFIGRTWGATSLCLARSAKASPRRGRPEYECCFSTTLIIGTWVKIYEDARGLFVRGKLAIEVAKAREVLSLMRAGAIDGLSIGFRTVKGVRDRRSGVRRLEKIDLWEISVVTFPMLPEARISNVKCHPFGGRTPTEREFERWLTQDAGFTRSEARAVLRDGLKGLRLLRDAGRASSWEQRLLGQLAEATRLLSQPLFMKGSKLPC
jgi:hypothetical protein